MSVCKGCGYDMEKVAAKFTSWLCSASCWHAYMYRLRHGLKGIE